MSMLHKAIQNRWCRLALAVAATAVLMLMSARFFLWLRELEDYARRENL